MKICLCGSTRFRDDYEAINRLLSKAGHVVYSVASFVHHEDDITPDIKETLDLVHLRKVQESELVVIVGEKDGESYVGDSTRKELKWAQMIGVDAIRMRDADALLPEAMRDEFFTTFGYPRRDEQPVEEPA